MHKWFKINLGVCQYRILFVLIDSSILTKSVPPTLLTSENLGDFVEDVVLVCMGH